MKYMAFFETLSISFPLNRKPSNKRAGSENKPICHSKGNKGSRGTCLKNKKCAWRFYKGCCKILLFHMERGGESTPFHLLFGQYILSQKTS